MMHLTFYHLRVYLAREFSPIARIFLAASRPGNGLLPIFLQKSLVAERRRFNEMHNSAGAQRRMSSQVARYRAVVPGRADRRIVRPGGRYRWAERTRLRGRPPAAGSARRTRSSRRDRRLPPRSGAGDAIRLARWAWPRRCRRVPSPPARRTERRHTAGIE